MPDFNFKDDLVAKKIQADSVKDDNITLCVTNNFLEVTFEEDAWSGTASKVISSCRQK